MKKILVTGGNGFIGTNIIQALRKKKYSIDIIDKNKKNPSLNLMINKYHRGDLKNKKFTEKILKNKYDLVIHCASYIEVGESVLEPLKYYENNFISSYNLISSMIKNDCKKIIFSSSAAIYGKPNTYPITEKFKLKPINPYGYSKLMVEKLLSDLEKAYNFKYISLRYFNASGASKKFGEMHNPETHLIPLIMRVASGRMQNINIYGNKYKTKDGTCIRDYIHVADIADAHVKSAQYLFKFNKSKIFNLGSEGGRSVGEIIKLSRKITNKKIKVKILPKRLGDPSVLIASSFKIKKILKWKPKFSSMKNILQSAWNWEKKLLRIKNHKF